MTHINLYSVKGGQGVSTTAVLLAKQYANNGQSVLLVDREGGDLPALLGIPDSDETLQEVSSLVSLLITNREDSIPLDHSDVVISDLGGLAFNCQNFLVTHPDYVSLRHAIKSDTKDFANGVIVVRPPNRVLTDRDVSQVLGLTHTATIRMTEAVARASDAGLLLIGRAVTVDIPLPLTV